MSSTVSFNGSTYIIPSTGEVGWGSNVSNYLIAIAAGALQKTGGSFTLSAEVDFGASFGLKALYYKSRGTNVAASGINRYINDELGPTWRNAANNGDLGLSVSVLNQLTFNGTPIGGAGIYSASRAIVSDGSGNLTSATTTATEISYVNGVTSAIQTQLNAKQSSSLTSAHIFVGNVSNVATDVAVSGDVTLTNTGNFQIAAGVIVNADINSAAAIAITKIANGIANQLIGANSGASANEFKTLSGTSNQVTVTNGAGTITLATPQSIDTAAAVQFGSLTLGGALDASSILSLTSTTKGFLPPVMTTTQRNAITTPSNGLVVYDSSLAQLYLRSAGSWTPLSTGGGSGTVASGTQYQMSYYANTGTTVSGTANIVTDVSGNLNVTGQTSPNLYITSTSGSGVQGRLLASTTAALYILTQTNHPIYFTTNNGANALTIETNKNVTVPNGSLGIKLASPNDAIEVAAGNNITIGQSGTNNTAIGNLKFGTGSTDDRWAQIQGFRGADAAHIDLRFFTFNSDGEGVAERLRLTTTGTALHFGNIQFNSTSTQGIVGTTTNDSAAAGNVGEAVRSAVANVSTNTTTDQYADLTSISLTAGDWDISGSVNFEKNASTWTIVQMGISSTSGNSGTGLVEGDNFLGIGFNSFPPLSFPITISSFRVSLSSTTTYYLKVFTSFSAGQPKAYGRISARRIR